MSLSLVPDLDEPGLGEPDRLELGLLPAEDFTDRASVQEFVLSQRFESLSDLVACALCNDAVLSPETDRDARGIALALQFDLIALAGAAARPVDCPLLVARAESRFYMDTDAEVPRFLEALALTMAMDRGSIPADSTRCALDDLVTYYQQQIAEA